MKHLEFAHILWQQHLNSSDFAIDFTCGNGHDTHFLATLLPHGLVYGIDLQKTALQETHFKTKEFKHVILFELSHPALPPLPKAPRLAVYNLGYLPKGDKTITTMADTTIESLKKVVQILSPDGAISITCYPGHDTGLVEEKAVIEWASNLPFQQWDVYQYSSLNRKRSPSLIWIKRKTLPHLPKNNPLEYLA